MKTISCLGKDGKKGRFKYGYEETFNALPNKKAWIFRVYPELDEEIEFFEFQVAQIEISLGKVTMMHHHEHPKYIAKGIPEKMIEEAYDVLKINIISSTNSEKHKVFKNEYITESAQKVWRRLIVRGKAFYDDARQVYCYRP